MQKLRNYLSLIKFSHTIFAMPFALIGFFLGMRQGTSGYVHPFVPGRWFDSSNTTEFYIRVFVMVILCMVLARSAAMAFNRYLDKNFDALNPRTAIREIPAGIIHANHALLFTIICSFLFMISAFFINPLCFYLSPVALAVILGYSYTKRFTPLCHLVLGLGLSLAPIGAYLAVTAQFALVPVLISIAVLLWVSGFDIIYALQDEEFDKANKLHSIPAAVGKAKALKISGNIHFVCGMVLLYVFVRGQFSWLYFIGWLIFITMLTYQHAIVRPNDLSRVNLAFMTANGIASIVFAVFVISDVLILH